MTNKLDFLTSRKFWVLVGIAVLEILKAYNILPAELVLSLVTLGYGYIGINIAGKVVGAQ